MNDQQLSPDFLRLLSTVRGKRPRTVIDHILRYGQITTEELKDKYGYNHPPRAIRDVREHGIPIETLRVIGSDGRRIAAYRFGDPSEMRATQLSGRTAFSSRLKDELIEAHGPRCNIYLEHFPERELQIDHRVPFEIAGDSAGLSNDPQDYMLLCASANRAKSWSCENCKNWQERDINTCQTCYWAYPEEYSHIAMREIRRMDLMWSGDDVVDYDHILEAAGYVRERVPKYVKKIIRDHLNEIDD